MSAFPSVIQASFVGGRPAPAVWRAASGHRGAVALTVQPKDLGLLQVTGGQPLPAALARRMESLCSQDFSSVRVHQRPQAAALGAMAFTHGGHLYFAPGHYDPASPHGQRLIAHELAHVVQQRAGRVRNPFGTGLALVHDLGLEAEAERMSWRLAATAASAARPRQTGMPLQARFAPAAARRRGWNAVGLVQRTEELRQRGEEFKVKLSTMRTSVSGVDASSGMSQALDGIADTAYPNIGSQDTGAVALAGVNLYYACTSNVAPAGFGSLSNLKATAADGFRPHSMHAEMIIVYYLLTHGVHPNLIKAVGVAGDKGCCRGCSAILSKLGIAYTKTVGSKYENTWQDPFVHAQKKDPGYEGSPFGGGTGLSSMEWGLL